MSNLIQGELLESLANLAPTRYACAAGTVVCFYDFILTFPHVRVSRDLVELILLIWV